MGQERTKNVNSRSLAPPRQSCPGAASEISILFKLTSTESLVLSNHLILCCPLLLLPSIFPSKGGHFPLASSSHQVTKVVELQLQHQLKIYIYIN